MDLNMRINGIYPQRQAGFFMLRVKIPSSILSSEQALKLVEIGERYANGTIHLTSRASMEFHWLREENLEQCVRLLGAVGLTSRGACGGAVRGVACSTSVAAAQVIRPLATRLHRHFTGNQAFEGLPKKFKIGIESEEKGGRHLIQDAGLVYRGEMEGESCYDIWIAGGLGREPQAGFLLEAQVPEGRVVPLLEAVIRVYRREAASGKRLKHVARALGPRELVRSIRTDIDLTYPLTRDKDICLSPGTSVPDTPIQATVFAGELATGQLALLAEASAKYGDGYLSLSPDQDILLYPAIGKGTAPLAEAVAAGGFDVTDRVRNVTFRVCPGNHECRLGLAPTRDVARKIIEAIPPGAENLSWALSGCPNSCSQPQLAEWGIVTCRLRKNPSGEPEPFFDLYHRTSPGLGTCVQEGLDLQQLLHRVSLV